MEEKVAERPHYLLFINQIVKVKNELDQKKKVLGSRITNDLIRGEYSIFV